MTDRVPALVSVSFFRDRCEISPDLLSAAPVRGHHGLHHAWRSGRGTGTGPVGLGLDMLVIFGVIRLLA